MHEQPRNRDWVKNAAIIFLVVILVLTFFSNTIMNRSLPEVASQEVTSGSIIARVRGTGTVQANSNTQVKMDKTRVIRSVLVKVGQQVEAGDVLFTLGEGASEEIDAAQEKVMSLQASYNRMAATIPDYSYGADHRRIAAAEEAYNEAKRKYDSILAKMEYEEKNTHESQEHRDQKVAEAAARLKAAQLLKDTAEELYNAQIAKKEEALEKAKNQEENYNNNLAEITSTQNERDAILAMQSQKSDLETEVDSLQKQIEELDNLLKSYTETASGQQLQMLRGQKQALQEQLDQIQSEEEADQQLIQDLNDQIAALQAQIDPIQLELDQLDLNADERAELLKQIQPLKEEQDRLSYNLQAIGMNDYNKEEINNQYTSIIEQIQTIEDQAATISQTMSELERQRSELQQQQDWDKNKIAELDVSLVDSTTKIEELNSKLESLLENSASPSEIEELMHELANVSEADLDAAIAYLSKCQMEYQDAWADKDPKLNNELQYAKESLRSAELAYVNAKESLRDKIESNDRNLAGINVDLANLWNQIQRAQAKLDELLGGEDATIVAKASGTIKTLTAGPGDTKKKDDIIATIEVPDMGYKMSFSVTNEQANRLRVGDTGTVSNFYWGSEITATLTSIEIDQKNPATNKLLTFDLSGNVSTGTELTVSVGQKSANYDVIVPSSSVRTDANGSYVLKLDSKNSPLGNRYYARRVPVEVLAVDDSNSALNADLSFGDYVITSSSTPLKNGEMVRLATGS